MGVNAHIYARGDLAQNGAVWWKDATFHGPADHGLTGEWWDGTAFVDTPARWYGPGYERGNWPLIYATIRQMQVTFPKAAVFYRSDHDSHDDPGSLCIPESLESQWLHYLGPSGDAYWEFDKISPRVMAIQEPN